MPGRSQKKGKKMPVLVPLLAVGFVAAFLIYISLFIYGTQVMRGVIEEKTTRIIEVIVSSVKPFQLMLGKILGIGMVGLTQFLFWIVLSAGLATVASTLFINNKETKAKVEQLGKERLNQANPATDSDADMLMNLTAAASTVDVPYIIGTFLFYFLGGYLIYSALFAAVGSAVDNETETQQFMLPITLPLIFTFIIGMNVIANNPDSRISFWLSMIPFHLANCDDDPDPIWGARMGTGLVYGLFDCRIYLHHLGSITYLPGWILMYGKKTSYKELAKWFMYKE